MKYIIICLLRVILAAMVFGCSGFAEGSRQNERGSDFQIKVAYNDGKFTNQRVFSSVSGARRIKEGTGKHRDKEVARQLAFQNALGKLVREIRCTFITTFQNQKILNASFTSSGRSEDYHNNTSSNVFVRSSVQLEGIRVNDVSGYPKRHNDGSFEHRVRVSVAEEYIQDVLRGYRIRQQRYLTISQLARALEKRVFIKLQVRFLLNDSNVPRYDGILRTSLISTLNYDDRNRRAFSRVLDSTQISFDIDEQLKRGNFVIVGEFNISSRKRNKTEWIDAKVSALRIHFDPDSQIVVVPFLSRVIVAEGSIDSFMRELGIFAGQLLRDEIFEELSLNTYIFQPVDWKKKHLNLFHDYLKLCNGYQTYRYGDVIVCTYKEQSDREKLDLMLRILEDIRFPEGSLFSRDPLEKEVFHWRLQGNPSVFEKYAYLTSTLVEIKEAEKKLLGRLRADGYLIRLEELPGSEYCRYILAPAANNKEYEKYFYDEIVDKIFEPRTKLLSYSECKGVEQFIKQLDKEIEMLRISFGTEIWGLGEYLSIQEIIAEYYRRQGELQKLLAQGNQNQEIFELLEEVEKKFTNNVSNIRIFSYAYYLLGSLHIEAYHRIQKKDFFESARSFFQMAMERVDREKDAELNREIQKAIDKIKR